MQSTLTIGKPEIGYEISYEHALDSFLQSARACYKRGRGDIAEHLVPSIQAILDDAREAGKYFSADSRAELFKELGLQVE